MVRNVVCEWSANTELHDQMDGRAILVDSLQLYHVWMTLQQGQDLDLNTAINLFIHF